MYGEEATRTHAAGPTPSSARRDQLPSEVAIGVPDVGRDCRVVGLRKAVWDLRRKAEDPDERKSDRPELEAQRLLLIVALVTDEDVGIVGASNSGKWVAGETIADRQVFAGRRAGDLPYICEALARNLSAEIRQVVVLARVEVR